MWCGSVSLCVNISLFSGLVPDAISHQIKMGEYPFRLLYLHNITHLDIIRDTICTKHIPNSLFFSSSSSHRTSCPAYVLVAKVKVIDEGGEDDDGEVVL